MSNSVPEKTKANILDAFLDKYLEPAFGSLPKTEIDMLVLELLEQTGRIKKDINQYDLSQKLRISQTKARNLLYNRTMRKCNEEELNNMVKKLLRKPVTLSLTVSKDKCECEWILLHVENPLLIEHIRNKIYALEHIYDGSFSQKIIKLKVEAFAALIESYIQNQDEISEILKGLGIPDGSLKNFLVDILKSSTKTLANQVAGEIGTKLVNGTLDYLPNLWHNSIKIVSEQIKKLHLSAKRDKE